MIIINSYINIVHSYFIFHSFFIFFIFLYVLQDEAKKLLNGNDRSIEYNSTLKIRIIQIPTLSDSGISYSMPSKSTAYRILAQRASNVNKINSNRESSTKTLNIVAGTCSIFGVVLLVLMFKLGKKLYNMFVIRRLNGKY